MVAESREPTVYPERRQLLWLALNENRRFCLTFPESGLSWFLWQSVKIDGDKLLWENGLTWPLAWITEPEDLVARRVLITPLGRWPLFRPLATEQPLMTSKQLTRWVCRTYGLTTREVETALQYYAVPEDIFLQRCVDLALQFKWVLPEASFAEFLRRDWVLSGDWTAGEFSKPIFAVLNGHIHHVEEALLKSVGSRPLLPYVCSGGTLANPLAHSLFALPR